MSRRIAKYTDMGWPEQDALWKYDLLPESLLFSELARLSAATTYRDTDCVTFQPSPHPEDNNQDRYAVFDWPLNNGTWHFRAVFDGHAGHETVDHVVETLPGAIQRALADLVCKDGEPSVETVSDILKDTISTLDDDLTKSLLNLFPDPDVLETLSDEEIRTTINDQESGGVNSDIVTRCMRGTTVLVSLLDPKRCNIWVASLGDCQAALGARQSDGYWKTSLLSSHHNGTNLKEKEVILKEHPGESECIMDDRVLGAIAVTRDKDMELLDIADSWIQLLANKNKSWDHSNLALYLLRDAIGGDDIDMASRMITVEMGCRWMDDTTILVQKLSKTYTTEGAFKSHINSKKHKENETKAANMPKAPLANSRPSSGDDVVPSHDDNTPSIVASSVEEKTSLVIRVTTDDMDQSINEKIAAARARLSFSHCLFCPQESTTLEENLTHMSQIHSFFIPDADYLIDIPGLITYLGEKIAVGNFCIFCNDKGREFRSLDAVRKHMVDKSHCKIAYESSDDRLEISDFYDFTSSYPDFGLQKKKRREEDEVWEDIDGQDGSDVDEVVDKESDLESNSDESLPDNDITYGDSHLELVLPSGTRIGHRTMRRYYAQSFPGAPRGNNTEDPNSGAALVRRLLADKNSALVPRKGGFGAFGSGTEVIKARNRGEAREAGRHVREFRDQKRHADFKTKVGFIHNSQKHFRDPLLQVDHRFCSWSVSILTFI
ncbi:hypothetical protein H0H81_005731 [Sphagnurus paluster]|uniref:PPM-type phosphatase domain-containing protein n=1 Tax=Sphagnurus paluster TaxID=117069 RepID=A0A9P7GS90_9AGAR|nr:hypothetical protein H0H81_005731 [Sphagnurus paluster]